jgi:hypothetical protein
MSQPILIVLIVSILLLSGCSTMPTRSLAEETETSVSDLPATGRPVLVELFTSEGCSSCPPADRVLSSLARDQGIAPARVIALGFHVDYWDYLGWKDRFASAAFSRRQEAYARQFKINSTYTPQMVVDGALEFVGSNRVNAIDAVKKNAASPKPVVSMTVSDGRLRANAAGLPMHTGATVYLAVAENNLITKVGRGENSGSTLEHAAVVRDFSAIGKIAKSDTTFTVERTLPPSRDWKTENVKLVVFVQEDATLKILAVNEIQW